MIGAGLRFPAIDDWIKMDEQEQDALLAQMEAARRRKSWFSWVFVAGLSIAAFVALALRF